MKKISLALALMLALNTQSFARNVTKQELKVISARVSENFKDPDSAKFSNVKIDENKILVCGLVNAKNSYGGYTGASPFFGEPITKGNVMVDFKLTKITEVGNVNDAKLLALCQVIIGDF